ncbi:diaminopimelate epimerase [Halorubrum ezzemoulense]|uniref:Diaminopimelate epimerase n=1 Tax=Halorubrum ezzemoulense TaxID=337243 RepID=A0A238V5E5_HALEZ|nr:MULTISPECIES: diaminopimelate epimerase [Halorubrum]MDB9279401.1 diaminopimelate epimerase [Halorubrum ezzemoulense]MDB9282923.1 diaminopimelate epimerase [Halorubrum ezzemoulense]TKX42051.1 diaminopimelate epimerase [Halorubrum sp. CGM4_25_10-8A]TKX47008.1 diaminopimelate epimerase [Halorubrum sp. SD690R]SNR28749.1 diaminopimelate epimerase [Halorubrum ezzemoulense]
MSAHAVPVEKYHGTGNDFIVVDADAEGVGDRAAFARAHCDRGTGVEGDGDRRGADGVLFLSVAERFDPTRVVMTLVQPDGSTATMCGNGARVVARWANDRTGDREFMIDTQAGTRRATVNADATAATIEMGEPTFDPRRVPAARGGALADEPLVDEPVAGLPVTAVNTGVPHAVAFVDGGRDDPDGIDAVDLDAVAPPVRHADAFPEGANVNLAAVVDDGSGDGPAVLDQRTFERGVEGETRSCGTGAVAVVAAARRLGLIEGETAVSRPPGGELEIAVPDRGHATLTGPVAHEFSGTLPADPR